METPFHGQIDLAILRRMNRLILVPSRKGLVIGGLAAVFLLWGLIGPALLEGEGMPDLTAPLIFVLLAVGVMAYALIAGPRKALQSSKLFQEPFTGMVSETGVLLETKHTRADLPWEVFFKCRIGNDLILLYRSAQLFSILPREFFASDGDWQAVVDLVRQQVTQKPQQGQSPLVKAILLWLVIFVVVLVVWALTHR